MRLMGCCVQMLLLLLLLKFTLYVIVSCNSDIKSFVSGDYIIPKVYLAHFFIHHFECQNAIFQSDDS